MKRKVIVNSEVAARIVSLEPEIGFDVVSLEFRPDNPRYVKMITSQAGFLPDYSEERLAKIKSGRGEEKDTDSRVERLGIFADDMPQNIVTRVYNFALDYVRLDGEESSTMLHNLRRTLVPDITPSISIIKGISISSPADFRRCREYEGAADMLMLKIAPQEAGAIIPEDIIACTAELKTPFFIEADMEATTQLLPHLVLQDGFLGVSIDDDSEAAIERIKSVSEMLKG